MPRFESTAGRFWEIILAGNALQTRYGRIGTDGRLGPTKRFDSPESARKEAKKRMASKVRDGFLPVDDDVSSQLVHPQLAAAIVRDSDASTDAWHDAATLADLAWSEPGPLLQRSSPAMVRDPYLVYGDWLQSQGDPRGELVAMQSLRQAPGSHPGSESAMAAERHFIATHSLVPGRLARHIAPGGAGECAIKWRLGFVHRARIGRSPNSSDSPAPHTVRELCRALFAHPSAQVLYHLTIGSLGSPGAFDYEPVVAEIGHSAPTSLRELWVADFTADPANLALSRLGEVTGIYRRLLELRRLHLQAGSMALGSIHLPALRHLAITSFALDPVALEAIARAQWPVLRALELCVAGAPLPASAFDTLLSSPHLAGLEHLRLAGTDSTDQLWLAVAGSPLASGLCQIDISGGSLTDRDIESLLRECHVFARLTRLDISKNVISDPALAELRQAFGQLDIDLACAGQREPAIGRPVMTVQEIYEFAPSARAIAAARRIASPGNWPLSGSQGAVLWGRCQGSDLYDVCVDTDAMASECTCPSRSRPCKHSIALLFLAQNHSIEDRPPPEGFIGNRVVDAAPF